jgi:type III pantothenate kinase
MKLLVDIGNTRLKAALWDGAALRPLGAAAHSGGTEVDFAALWKDAGAVDAAYVASVAAPALGERLRASVRERFGTAATFVSSPAAACGVRNAYDEPQRLGIDRFLGLVAVHAEMPGPCVLAGCGTALTLDALAADGTHLGGLIAPSPTLMLDALAAATARLARPNGARVVEIADDTADAMQSGTRLAAVALIERFLARAGERLGVAATLILTGGGSAELSALLAPAHRVEPDLVLRGLARFADEMPGSSA